MDIKDIEHLALLARMDLTEEEKQALLVDMDKILEFVGQVQSLSEDTEEKAQIPGPHNVLRTDTDPHEGGIYTDRLLDSSPATERQHVKVKKILSYD